MPDAKIIDRYLAIFLLIAAGGPLLTAYISQFGFGYEPCVLCVYQRIPYGVVIALGVLALFVKKPDIRRLIPLFAGLAFLIGSGIALYHVGVEQLWWESAAPCGASGAAVTNTQDFLAALQKKPEKSCGDIDWTLFGISMATYNVGVSLALAIASFFAWRRMKDEA
ncbi:MAG: disulfide bond formation protein B [Rhodospirillales bacterium]|nr:disulfide bond formation protein B [Rhodospirillales bacterium]